VRKLGKQSEADFGMRRQKAMVKRPGHSSIGLLVGRLGMTLMVV